MQDSSQVSTTPGRTRTCDPRFRKPRSENRKHKQEQGLTNTPDDRLQTSLQTNSKNTRKQAKGQVPELSDELAGIIESWARLPEHVRQAIVTLVASVTVTAKDSDEVV